LTVKRNENAIISRFLDVVSLVMLRWLRSINKEQPRNVQQVCSVVRSQGNANYSALMSVEYYLGRFMD